MRANESWQGSKGTQCAFWPVKVPGNDDTNLKLFDSEGAVGDRDLVAEIFLRLLRSGLAHGLLLAGGLSELVVLPGSLGLRVAVD